MGNTPTPVTLAFGRAWKLRPPQAARRNRSAMKRAAKRAARHAMKRELRGMPDFGTFVPKYGRKMRVDGRDVV